MAIVIDEVRRIEGLVREFLDFAHPKEPKRERLVVRDIVDRLAALSAPEFESRGMVFVVTDESHEATAELDGDQIAQALLNLVLNAMDATPQGGKIEARLTRTARQITIAIIDAGKGVATGDALRLFEPFFTTKARGSGLGLATVRTVAEAHGGSAEYRATAGGGATFLLNLPL